MDFGARLVGSRVASSPIMVRMYATAGSNAPAATTAIACPRHCRHSHCGATACQLPVGENRDCETLCRLHIRASDMTTLAAAVHADYRINVHKHFAAVLQTVSLTLTLTPHRIPHASVPS